MRSIPFPFTSTSDHRSANLQPRSSHAPCRCSYISQPLIQEYALHAIPSAPAFLTGYCLQGVVSQTRRLGLVLLSPARSSPALPSAPASAEYVSQDLFSQTKRLSLYAFRHPCVCSDGFGNLLVHMLASFRRASTNSEASMAPPRSITFRMGARRSVNAPGSKAVPGRILSSACVGGWRPRWD